MAITSLDLGGGKWQITDDVKQVAYVTDMDLNAEQLRQNESELTRANTRADDYEANKDYYTTAAAGITGATIPPIADTNPVQYLLEWPPGNPYTSTEAQNNQRLSTATANEDYMRVTEIPNIQTEIDNGDEIASQIDTPPTGGSEFVYDWDIPTPLEIPAQPVINVDGALQMTVDVTLPDDIKYVEVTFNTDHPSSALEPLVGGIKFNGMVRPMWAQDFLSSNDTATFGSSYYNGLSASGTWIIWFINDATTETNLLNDCSLKIFY